MKKFNSKSYQGKSRVYSQLSPYSRISKLWIWNESKREYESPERGKAYCAKRYISAAGGRKRMVKFFASLQDALDWQAFNKQDVLSLSSEAVVTASVAAGPLFRDFLQQWRKLKYCDLRQSTRMQYEKLLNLYFAPFMEVYVESINSQTIDAWIAFLKNPESGCSRNPTRFGFKHELRLLNTILKDYVEYNDNTSFRNPIKKRHRKAIILREREHKSKEISEAAFLKFVEQLRAQENGQNLAVLATVQYYQSLRISEAAAIAWEDLRFNFDDPKSSRLVIGKSVYWPRKKGHASAIVNSFKNSKSLRGFKEQPVFYQSYKALLELHRDGIAGQIFGTKDKPLEYRTIQNAYDTAFKRAGLPFSGTHIMRHGGTQRVFNKTSDLPMAGQLLGNTNADTIKVYAQRSTGALTDFAKKEWIENSSDVIASGCNQSTEK